MYVAIRDAHLKQTGIDDCWLALKELGIDAVEVAVGDNQETFHLPKPDGITPYDLNKKEDIEQLGNRLKDERVRISAFLMANDFLNQPEQEIVNTSTVVNAAEALDVSAIRVDMVPRGQKEIDLGAFAKQCAEAASKIIEGTKACNVSLAVENHGRISNQPEFLENIFNAVESERMGQTLDTGNFYWWGHPIDEVYEIMQRFVARVRHTHAKNICYPEDQRRTKRKMGWEYKTYACPVHEGDIDHKRVVKMLADAGYQGSLTLENECIGKFPESDRLGIFKQELQHLKACLD